MLLNTIESRSSHSRCVTECDRMITAYLDKDSARHPNPLKRVGLTREEVKRMTEDMQLPAMILAFIRKHGSVRATTLAFRFDRNPWEIAKMVTKLIEDGNPIERTFITEHRVQQRAYRWGGTL